MYKFVFCLFFPLTLFAQQLVSSFSLDTSKYEYMHTTAIRGPEQERIISMPGSGTELLSVYRLKNTDKCDIFSFSGKIASITVPDKIKSLRISQFFIDEDAGWEYIGDVDGIYSYSRVFDENGKEILSDTGYAFYGYDGQNTYVCYTSKDISGQDHFNVYQFRTNVASTAPQKLSKTSGTQLQRPIITYCPSGNYQVSLKPVSGGKTSVQIYDLLGRLTFSKVLSELTETTTLTIPVGNVPQAPFITRTKNTEGQTVQTTIPAW